jgi:hypothetical protein
VEFEAAKTFVPILLLPALLFFRGDQKILSDAGFAGFARLTPGPDSWHDRGMKVGFISILRGFHPGLSDCHSFRMAQNENTRGNLFFFSMNRPEIL